ncbi:MAG: energy-coupling factor transporter transmembrane protein EcfT [Xylanivirga thermophila]|jgi:energy-coupling factor transport system permease protein|uniref:energy-coupling factor transporter transmembrane component T family protein n=1 Tax=Xylanivirga thermophila TaxID=2496273 RepID=UPI00101BF46A|nr:energy-coupling factor transporter transmembrane component T [Xylanivirga thermophila]
MLKDITIGQYFPGNSPIHLLDPRVKIALTFLFIIIIFFIKTYIGYGLAFAYLAFVIIMSGIPFRYILKSLRPLMFIIILTFIINIFFTPGENVLFTIWRLKVTQEGLNQAIFMALRLVFLVAGTSLLTLTTSPVDLTDGLELIFDPLKVIHFPAHELAMMMTIALRFIPTLLEETDKIMKAQMARGADFESGNIMQRAKSLVPLLVPLFISAFRRADELAMAMEARCYRGGDNRTRMKTLKTEKRDYIAIAISVALSVIILLDSHFMI